MITIKEIAKMSGFSPSTVSIVLSGKSTQRKISEDTKNKVLDIAHQLGYRVNVAARRLKANSDLRTMLSVFMAMDQRAYIMTRFLLGLQNAALELEQNFEIAVHFYESGSLHNSAEAIGLTNCAIICNTSDDDLLFLEEKQFSVPIVLYNRNSEKYSSVITDFRNIGKTVAEIFARRKHKHAVLVGADAYFNELKQSTNQFVKTAENYGLSVKHIHEPPNMKSGYNAGIIISGMNPLPDCMFSLSDALSIGALHAFKQKDIKLPEQIELISIGIESPDWEEYASVPISSMHMPVETMAAECVKLLLLQMDSNFGYPYKVVIPSRYVQRETCGV